MTTETAAAIEGVDGTEAIELYRLMVRAQRADARIRKGLSSGDLAFSYWPTDGQEAISAAAALALHPGDELVTTYRGLADVVAKGIPLRSYFAELLGKGTGVSKGKAGAMGVSDKDVGIALSTGIVGAGPLIANGLALAAQMAGKGGAVLVTFGDGATSIGFVHEAMNMAALWSLPIVFLCQNNLWAECTPVHGYTRTERLADRAAAYGMSGVVVDGTNPLAAYKTIRSAVEQAHAGSGPTLVEAIAYRLQGHYFGDVQTYVDADELAAARAAHPVGLYDERLVAAGIATREELDKIGSAIDAEVEDAIEFARASDGPDASELYRDVYAGRTDNGALAIPVSRVEVPKGETEDLGLVQAINRTLDRALERDERVLLLGEDIADPAGGIFKVTAGLSTKHGTDRVRATPIAESSIIGAAVGASLAGLRPVAELMFMDFLGVALDQIANHAAKIRYMSGGRLSAPMVIRTAVGTSAGPQHSQALEAWAMHIPGLKVVWPSTAADAVGLLNACIEDEDPCLFIESMKLFYGAGRTPVPLADFTLPLGSADVKREGTDVTIVTYGAMVQAAVSASADLADSGVDVEIVDLRTLVPLDLATVLESAAKTRRVVIAHESVQFCGAGAEIAAAVGEELFGQLSAPIVRVAGTFTPVPRGASLEALCRPDAAALVKAIQGMS
jgi:pyruvate/2-oxoglutarate/acetoin dehydrogenase E1 component/TPP-dependent pyruvate/acetoin dehydrogenase alpha subunit